jgi:putative transposase
VSKSVETYSYVHSTWLPQIKHTYIMSNTKTKYTATDSVIIQELIKDLYENKPLAGPDGAITRILKIAYEAAMEGEADAFLEENKLEQGNNRKNGKSKKTVTSSYGKFELETPRDRNSEFNPYIIKKRQTIINDEINNKILSLYAMGNSYDDISRHVQDIYGFSVSDGTINSVTDKLLDKISEWKTRSLESTYAVVFMDAMFFKVRENGVVVTKVMYNLMGINMKGLKDILGFYISDSEGSAFWLSVLNDLKNRGVNDILIAAIDGLKGFPDAISAAFPSTEVQLCIVHQIRNSCKFIPSKFKKDFITDLKSVYTQPS